ncbi:potassium-transporting ATPase subunit F [Bifidobacterium psychraerophilum]|jgi:K+-transporting ATPase KdpF subunit|nr:potassium-transporting ATPase subunit F [Bifidobacterium psychraerophilum]MCI1660229.1 potassium-transporting ATPase subunit F [Bifidobacterium psychraerophilum]MCI1803894.1 potassium-transporting ATPase subunit F [Bifidobacterium psychraerophilum]MCI2175808.1 potassium-transporting ATPase subunit F [Bifidobacterium psychraerophilum]MCI2182464.1 potassium-transporting ATPase subunit F [Bifidobacterium psychraerophilum]
MIVAFNIASVILGIAGVIYMAYSLIRPERF